MSLLDFNNIFDTYIKSEDCDIINSYTILNIENYELEVVEVYDNRIKKLKFNFTKERVS